MVNHIKIDKFNKEILYILYYTFIEQSIMPL